MSPFELARKPKQWLRAALAGLLLAFAINSIAHVTHTHEQDKVSTVVHAAACGYCTTFSASAPATAYAHALPAPGFVRIDIAGHEALPHSLALVSDARARAPPRFLKHA